jgi:3-keto-disaccharide hydrolase
MRMKRHVSFAILLALVISATLFAATFFEDFSTMPAGSCYPDGFLIGVWQFVYNGYGCNAFLLSNDNTMLVEQPKASTRPDETHAALVLGPSIAGDFTLEAWTVTTRQLRTGSAPNTWEVGWILWNYTNGYHFYYFAAKPNGWELGKKDPAYPGAQRFLATGSAPSFPIGAWYRIGVTQSGDTIKVSVNDLPITTFSDRERPYSSGRIGMYNEDAETYFDNISISTSAAGKGKKK